MQAIALQMPMNPPTNAHSLSIFADSAYSITKLNRKHIDSSFMYACQNAAIGKWSEIIAMPEQ